MLLWYGWRRALGFEVVEGRERGATEDDMAKASGRKHRSDWAKKDATDRTKWNNGVYELSENMK